MSGLILVLNSGSSSLKFSVVDHSADRAVFEGLAEQLGGEAAKITFKTATGQREPQTMPGIDHHQALAAVFFSAVCIVISGPFWTRGWPEWWGWWLNLPVWS